MRPWGPRNQQPTRCRPSIFSRSNQTSTSIDHRRHYLSPGDFRSKNLGVSMTPYGELYATDTHTYADLFHRWRRFRRVKVEGFFKSVVHHLHPIQSRAVIMLSPALIEDPSNFEKHLQRHSSSIMFTVNYHFPPVA